MMDGKVYVPPLKIQGIKTKLVPLIQQTAPLSRDTVWIEPFMGSGVVGFNVAPPKAEQKNYRADRQGVSGARGRRIICGRRGLLLYGSGTV